MMKRILCMICCVISLTSLAACSSPDAPPTTTTLAQRQMTQDEQELYHLVPSEHKNCHPDRSPDNEKRWVAARAILFCESAEMSQIAYAAFENATAMDETYVQQAQHMVSVVQKADGTVKETTPGKNPCAASPYESGQWGAQTGDTYGGRFTCVSHPQARIVWTERTNYVIGEAQSNNLSMGELIDWWINKAGPK